MQSTRTCSVSTCERPVCHHGYCSAHYARWRRHGDVRADVPIGPATRTRPVEERFWEHVDKNGPIPTGTTAQGHCWIWTGHADGYGYGVFWDGDRQVKAYAYSYKRVHGPVQQGNRHDHICHIPLCVNPEHIVERTHQENGQNRSGLPSNNTSGVRGVFWAKWANMWRGRVEVSGKSVFVGYFHDLREAEVAVISRRIELHTANDLDKIRLAELTRPA